MNPNQNKSTQANPQSIINARESQLTRSVDAEYRALVSLEEANAQLNILQSKVSELTKQLDVRSKQLENLKSEYNVAVTKSSAFGWFIENLTQEIPDIPNTTIDSHVTARIIGQYQSHKTGEQHLANISLVNFAYGVHETPEPVVEEVVVEGVPDDQVTELDHGLNPKAKPVKDEPVENVESDDQHEDSNKTKTVNLKKRRK